MPLCPPVWPANVTSHIIVRISGSCLRAACGLTDAPPNEAALPSIHTGEERCNESERSKSRERQLTASRCWPDLLRSRRCASVAPAAYPNCTTGRPMMSQGLEIVSRRKTVKRYEDRREAPRYTSAEVARYLRLPESTLRAWFFGQTNFRPFFVPADSGRGLLSFYNLVEAHALSWAKQRHDELRPARIRHALEYVRERLPQYKRPLVTKRFSTDGKFLFSGYPLYSSWRTGAWQ